MSLEQLRELRRRGQRPTTATVIVGRPGKHFEDGPSHVVVARDGMDLSALVGLRVQVIDVQRDPALTLRVIAQLEGLKTALVGACGHYGVIADSPRYERALRRYREALCPTE